MAANPGLKKNAKTSLGFSPSSSGFTRAILERHRSRRAVSMGERAARLWQGKQADAAEKWKNPTAALLHSALKAAVAAVPFGGFVFDSEFLERVVQEVYPEWHARAQDIKWLTASERSALSNRMLTAVQAHVRQVAGQAGHPQSGQARQWLKALEARQKQVRQKLATDIRAFKTPAKKATPREVMLTNLRHIQRAQHALQRPVTMPAKTIPRPTLTASQLEAFRLRRRKAV